MEIQVAVAKINKYATSESGDSFEMIERPRGGLSFVLVDGQRSGKAAKNIANVVARKAISLIADGVRDGAAARAANDYLHNYRSGKVTATLNIVSVDLDSHSVRLACNNPVPVYLISSAGLETVGEESRAVGVRPNTRPVISEYTLAGEMTIVVYTDGLTHAGERKGASMDIPAALKRLHGETAAGAAAATDARRWADALLEQALALDDGRPTDDISVLVLAVREGKRDDVRRLSVTLPI